MPLCFLRESFLTRQAVLYPMRFPFIGRRSKSSQQPWLYCKYDTVPSNQISCEYRSSQETPATLYSFHHYCSTTFGNLADDIQENSVDRKLVCVHTSPTTTTAESQKERASNISLFSLTISSGRESLMSCLL